MSDSEETVVYLAYEENETSEVSPRETENHAPAATAAEGANGKPEDANNAAEAKTDSQQNVLFTYLYPKQDVSQPQYGTLNAEFAFDATETSFEGDGDGATLRPTSEVVEKQVDKPSEIHRDEAPERMLCRLENDDLHNSASDTECMQTEGKANMSEEGNEAHGAARALPGKCAGRIKDIDELKRATPRVKLLGNEARSLNVLTQLNARVVAASDGDRLADETSRRLRKYCRTCAGLKLPLVDIFSEKGAQMRLNQQMKHLEEIDRHDSLSTQMCMDCICDLKMSYKFFMQIKKAEVKLKSIYAALNDQAAKMRVARTDGPRAAKISQSADEEGEREAMPVVSGIFSLEEFPETADSMEIEEEVKSTFKVKSESETCDEDYSLAHQSDDNDSIEEFDPDDPTFQPDSSDAAESDHEFERSAPSRKSTHNSFSRGNATRGVQIDLAQNPGQTTICRYGPALKTYIKSESIKEEEESSFNANLLVKPKEETLDIDEPKSEGLKQPNILKRKRPSQIKPELPRETDATETLTTGDADSMLHKLNVHNAVNIGNAEEDGIMYVTVKGSKPNELLLVKVKKMDKPLDKKDERTTVRTYGRKSFDLKPVENILKKYESLTKDKDSFADRVKKPDIREQIIEEQIEEYKKKREKVLGGGNSVAMHFEDGQVRFVKQQNDYASRRSSELFSTDNSFDIDADDFERVDLDDEEEDDDDEDDDGGRAEQDDDENAESEAALEVDESPDERTRENTKGYLSRLARLKQKWEEAKVKRESLQRELDETCKEGNMEKLARILGEREKNLQDFQEYLKQRRIVITRLKDEDIISLYEDRNNAISKRNFPDLIDETQPADYVPRENYLECDYCSQTFGSRETLEEHIKIHDYKIMHYCEDCTEEFSTIKAKKTHNVACMKKLICRYCNLMLDSKGKKRQHEQKHCDSLYGQLCEFCGEKFKHQGTLDQHVKTQHMKWEKIFQCPKCPKKFAFKQKLSFHLKSVHTTMRAYLCEDCGADFKNPASLRHHRIRKHQPVGNKRECPVCRKLVPFYSLSKHMHTHKAYSIQCPHCDKMFKNTSTLKQHVRIHEDQRQYRCDTCGVGFNRRDGLRLHMRVHEKTDSHGLKECSCQVCGEKFPNHSMLVIHRNRVHKDGRQYTCHICNRSMISTRSLEWHMSHIHNESLPGVPKTETSGSLEKKRVSCYHCSKTFKTEMILRTHIKNTHMEKDPMKCLDCELVFTSDVRLKHHMMVAHNRLEGTLPCPHCTKRFVNQLRLKTHMISHSEERPYTCEICGFNLKTKIQLIKHHQNRHSDERPLQCRYCPWRCKQVSALVCHERTHTNERPYSCSVCRQRFKYLGDKNKHERRHESLGGSGFKRIVTGRNTKAMKQQEEDTSFSEQDQEELDRVEVHLGDDERYEEQPDGQYDGKYEEEEQMVKFEAQEISEEYEQNYEQEYEETSREASEAAEVIMNMEDTTVYTEEVTADNMESGEMITDEIITDQILQSGTVVHLQQQDDSGKIQVIPVMLSLPDLSDANAEVNLATASIMYNN